MRLLFLSLFTFKVVGAVTCAVYAYRIARLNLTRTFTYMLLCAAFVLRVVAQLRGVFYTNDIVGFLSGYNPWLIFQSQAIEVAISVCFIGGIVLQYYAFTRSPLLNSTKK